MATKTDTRAELRHIIDELPDDAAYVVLTFARFVVHEAQARPGIRIALGGGDAGASPTTDDPVLRALEAAPIDDEPITPEQAAALERRCASAARGETIADEDLARTLGR